MGSQVVLSLTRSAHSQDNHYETCSASAQATRWHPWAASVRATVRSSTISAYQVPISCFLMTIQYCQAPWPVSCLAPSAAVMWSTKGLAQICISLCLPLLGETPRPKSPRVGLGYCFSASLPPYLATAAIGALDVLEADRDALLPAVTGNARLLRSLLAEVPGEDGRASRVACSRMPQHLSLGCCQAPSCCTGNG